MTSRRLTRSELSKTDCVERYVCVLFNTKVYVLHREPFNYKKRIKM